jgi:hypothetical protein
LQEFQEAMLFKTNSLGFVLSIIGGTLLIVSGTRGPIGIFMIILQKLPLFIKDALVLAITTAAALILVVISSLGGFTVILGGYLIYKKHVGTGKLLIGLGAGVGIPWLLYILFTIMATQEVTAIIAQHSIVGWTGIIISFIARIIAR